MTTPKHQIDGLPKNPTVSDVQNLWDIETVFLDTASYGPPPRPAWEALQASLDQWRAGLTSWHPWVESVEVSREAFGKMVGIGAEHIATGAAVSQLLAPVAAAVPDGGTVLVPDMEFTSSVFPFAVHANRNVTVRTAPLASLAEAIDPTTSLISFSAAQSATGEVAELDRITRRAREVGAVTVLDTTQSVGWLPVNAMDVDVLTAAAYKWLCAPRGTAFMTVHPELAERHPTFHAKLRPLAAGWYAGEPGAHYGMPLRLQSDARAFDISPAWHSWVGTAPSLQVLNAVGIENIRQHNVGLANAFRTGLDVQPTNSAIVSLDIGDDAVQRLHNTGVRFSVMDGRARFAFHLYATEDDVATALTAVRGGR